MLIRDSEQIKKNNIFTDILLVMAVTFSVLSQIEIIENFVRPIMYILWILLVFVGCIKKKGIVYIDSFARRFILAYLLFFVLCVITSIIDKNHLSSNYLRVLIVPLLVTIVGCMYSDLDIKLINILGRVYIISSLVFAIWVHFSYFSSYSLWLNSRIYMFLQKNSAGQIWISAVFVAFFLLNYKKMIERIIYLSICAYLLIMTGFCQCRTALLGFAVALVMYSIFRAKHKLRLILLIVVFLVAIWTIPITHRFIEQALFLNKYAGSDVNTFTSGRIDKYKEAIDAILYSPFIGIGNYYVDCSYLLIIAESGILGFVIIEYIWIKKIILCFSYKGDMFNKSYLFVMTLFYIIESILEGYPPFGPGVSSFFFWFISCILINQSITNIKNTSIRESEISSDITEDSSMIDLVNETDK